jgi:hypothetical protein
MRATHAATHTSGANKTADSHSWAAFITNASPPEASQGADASTCTAQ